MNGLGLNLLALKLTPLIFLQSPHRSAGNFPYLKLPHYPNYPSLGTENLFIYLGNL